MEERLKKENLDIYTDYVWEGLRENILDPDLYCSLAEIYELRKQYDKAYLWYKGAMQYDCDDKIKDKLDDLKKNNHISVRNLSIIIVTHNNLEGLTKCIESILQYDKIKEFEIIVVDNDSNYDTSSYIHSMKDLKIVRLDEKKNLSYCFNRGIEAADKDNDLLFLDDDIEVLPNTILNMRFALYSNNNIGAVGALSDNFKDFNILLKGFDTSQEYYNFILTNNISDEDSYVERVFLESFSMLIKREVANLIGLFDENFICPNNGAKDYSLRIREENYKLILCNDSVIHHNVNQSKQDVYENTQEDKVLFKDKWGIDTDYSTSIRYDLINMFNYNEDDAIKVLEVGCGCGSSLMQIKKDYKNASVYGMDIDSSAIDIASKSIEAYCVDIENDKIPFNEEYFDIIILPDVLEHLRDPWEALKNIKRYLKKDGQMLVSIPNVMHISVIDNLLRGYWQYEDSGILDRTHLRFFTFNQIVQLFNYSGYDKPYIYCRESFISKDQEQRIDVLSNLYKTDPWQFRTYHFLTSTTLITTERIKKRVVKEADDDKMFAFIICTNDHRLLGICEYFISKIKIPEEYGLEILTISHAQYLTKAYNAALEACSAKYKIYIHQDVYITNENLLFDLLKIFEDKSIGLIGLAGCKDKPENGVWWDAKELVGNVMERKQAKFNPVLFKDEKEKNDLSEAFIVDGCFMASQYDLKWDDVNFDKWDFYDASQSLNYRNNNLKVVIPNVEESWIIHDCIDINLKYYYKYREIFVKEYYK